MNKALLLMGVACGATVLNAATIDRVIVRQQWPWSTDVKIEYQISGIEAGTAVDISVAAYDGTTPLDSTNLRAALTGQMYGVSENGVGTIMLDPVKAFGATKSTLADFNVELSVTPSAANVNEVLYKIVDMTSGAVEDVKRSDFLNGYRGAYETNFANVGSGFSTTLQDVLVWTDVTNHTEYMTSKMLFRKINAKGITWQMGETDSGPDTYQNSPCWVQLTNDYFIGVFPVTQYQYYSLRKMRGSYFTNETTYVDRDYYPAAGIAWGDLHGYTYGAANSWPATGHDVPAWTATAVMRSLCKLPVDLPTEAQWEFACRAGVYNKALYSGKSYSRAAILELAWVSDNAQSVIHPVNSKPPNAFGLYSMLGNSYEWTLCGSSAYPTAYTQENPELEPVGSAGSYRVARGTPYSYSRTGTTAALRSGIKYDSTGYCTGFRFWFPAE